MIFHCIELISWYYAQDTPLFLKAFRSKEHFRSEDEQSVQYLSWNSGQPVVTGENKAKRAKNRVPQIWETQSLQVVLLSELDSKKYEFILQKKEKILKSTEGDYDTSIAEESRIDNTDTDKFGEVAAKRISLTQKRLTPEEVKLLIVDYQMGKTPTELSEKYGCHRVTVGKILRRNGIELRPPHHNYNHNADELILGYQSGKSTYELAREYGCSQSTVSRILKEHGVDVDSHTAQKKLDVKVVISMYAEMHTTKEIAHYFGTSPKPIIQCLRKNGVKLRNRWDYT